MTAYEVSNLSRNSVAWAILKGHHIDPGNLRQEMSDAGYEYRATDRPQVIPWPKEFRFGRWIELARNTAGARVREIS